MSNPPPREYVKFKGRDMQVVKPAAPAFSPPLRTAAGVQDQEALEDAARKGVSAVDTIVQQRDQAIDLAQQYHVELTKLRTRSEILDRQMVEVTAKYEQSQRELESLRTRLRDIRGIIVAAEQEANEAAVVRPTHGNPTLTADEEARLQDLAQRLKPPEEKPGEA